MRMRLTGHHRTRIAALISFSAMLAFAQPQPPQQNPQEDVDPESPNHGAARISVMTGDVSVRRGDNGDFVAAVVNAPLVVGDRVLTGPDGRAEVQFDSANMIRVAP